MGEDEESGSAMAPVSRTGGRVRCYAPIPHPPQLPELSERVQTCLENGLYTYQYSSLMAFDSEQDKRHKCCKSLSMKPQNSS
jgi:hypothetical protein